MKYLALVVGMLAVALGAAAPAVAQETRFELAAGAAYPLLSQKFEAQQSLAWRLSAGVRLTPTITLAGIYEDLSTKSDIPNRPDGDLKLDLYGIRGTFVLNGEQDFQLIGFVGFGQGKLDFTNPAGDPGAGLVNNTDISFWWEIGGGAQFGLSKHWVLRLEFAGREVEPKEPSVVLSSTRFTLVPSAEIGFRF
jgi:opacity protein-like surface antigen